MCEAPTQQVAEEDFRALMAGFPTGVAVVTIIGSDGVPRGTTCSSVCSVSLVPPTLLVCLKNTSSTLVPLLDVGAFTVNLLGHDARQTAELFASGVSDRFREVTWNWDHSAPGPHLDRYAHSIADCQVIRADGVGDHTVIVGQVGRVSCREIRRPLLYGLRRYSAWPEPVRSPVPAGWEPCHDPRSSGVRRQDPLT